MQPSWIRTIGVHHLLADTILGSPQKLAPGVRQVDARGRRWFSDWYRRDIVRRCLEPGASLGVGWAMYAGLNANLVRKWVVRSKQHEAAKPGERSGDVVAGSRVSRSRRYRRGEPDSGSGYGVDD